MAAARSVVELLLHKLTDPLIREAFFSHGVGDRFEWLKAEFKRMRPFLKYADEFEQDGDEGVKRWAGVRPFLKYVDEVERDGDERVKKCPWEVIDVVYDAEDVIDTFILKIATLRRRGFVGCIKRYASFFDKLIGRHDVGSEMEPIKNKIRLISETMSTFGIQNIDQGAGTSSASLSLEQRIRTFPLTRDPDFVGFEEDLEGLVARLTEGELRRSVVSIVGEAGIGKTALAKEVYNDSRVKNHFEYRAWISLSRQYGLRHPLEKIVEQLFEEKEMEMKASGFDMGKISEYLKKKRYLIVLDYVCTKQTWDAVKGAFPDMKNGSRVMLTTRNTDVAFYADENSRPYELHLPNNENSLKLLCKKAFPGRDGYWPQDLKKLGRKIVENCDGLPLLIVITGRYLSRKEQTEWENSLAITRRIGQSFRRQVVVEEIEISDMLCFSYKYLPYYLKSCILYLTNFPKDHELHTKELIQLWAAEGLVEERGEETMEEVGEEYLKEIVRRGIVKVTGTSSIGGIKSCRIHSFLWYFFILEAEECKFSQVYPRFESYPYPIRARRLALLNQRSFSFSAPLLRSLLVYPPSDASFFRSEGKLLCRGFKLLRVLHLDGFKIENLPTEVGELILLRYLRCTKTLIESLPSSIANLPNLQTLHVTSTSDINIPSTILEMQQLRHLLVAGLVKVNYLGWMGNWGLIQGNPRLERISKLQTLSQVKPGEWIQGCLGKLTNLRKLGIALDTVADADVLYESIVKMDHLSSLSVVTLAHVNRTLGLLVPPLSHLLKLSKLRLEGKLDKLPESTEFPTNLTKLTLAYSCLNQDPMAVLEKLRNLRILRLLGYSYMGEEMVCSAQGFPQLESLQLQGLFQLVEWRVEVGAMPSLLHLQISTCHNLKKLPEGLRHLNTLKTLGLRYMLNDFQQRLRKYEGEDWHNVQHIPSIDINDDQDASNSSLGSSPPFGRLDLYSQLIGT